MSISLPVLYNGISRNPPGKDSEMDEVTTYQITSPNGYMGDRFECGTYAEAAAVALSEYGEQVLDVTTGMDGTVLLVVADE
jgi:hypothetical protein